MCSEVSRMFRMFPQPLPTALCLLSGTHCPPPLLSLGLSKPALEEEVDKSIHTDSSLMCSLSKEY